MSDYIQLYLTYCPNINSLKDQLKPFIHAYRRTILGGSKSFKSCISRDLNSAIPKSKLYVLEIF